MLLLWSYDLLLPPIEDAIIMSSSDVSICDMTVPSPVCYLINNAWQKKRIKEKLLAFELGMSTLG